MTYCNYCKKSLHNIKSHNKTKKHIKTQTYYVNMINNIVNNPKVYHTLDLINNMIFDTMIYKDDNINNFKDIIKNIVIDKNNSLFKKMCPNNYMDYLDNKYNVCIFYKDLLYNDIDLFKSIKGDDYKIKCYIEVSDNIYHKNKETINIIITDIYDIDDINNILNKKLINNDINLIKNITDFLF